MKSPKGTSKYHALISGLTWLLDSSLRLSLSQLYTNIYRTLGGKKEMKTKTVPHPIARLWEEMPITKSTKLKWTSKSMGDAESCFESWKRSHAGQQDSGKRHCSSSIALLEAGGSSVITNQDTGQPASFADNTFWCNLSITYPCPLPTNKAHVPISAKLEPKTPRD